MTCYFAKGNQINGKPYEETGIYRARTKATLLFLRLSVLVGRNNMGELSQGQFQTAQRK